METKAQRLLSLDALRGLDMLLIIGVDALVYSLAPLFPESGFWCTLREQMGHCAWEGLRIYDLVFPLFVMMAGISMNFSLNRQKREGRSAAGQLLKLWKRALLLVALGWCVNGAVCWDAGQMRYASVLGLIGISGALSGSWLILSRGGTAKAGLMAAALLLAVGIAQYRLGDFSPAGCFNSKVDTILCPGVLHSGSYDPEGPLCIVSATALSLLGFIVGEILNRKERTPLTRLAILASGGGLLIAIGCQLPVIKGIWTPGFVMCCGGIGMLLMALMHALIDVLGFRRWAYPLIVPGTNALFIYLATHLISFPTLANRMFGGTLRLVVSERLFPAALAAVSLLLAWGICQFLYQRRIFIRL